MNGKFYLFYEEGTLREILKKLSIIEKFFLIIWSVFAVFMLAIFVSIVFLATGDKLYVAILLSCIWLALFPGLFFASRVFDKSFYVSFEADCAVIHGKPWKGRIRIKKRSFYAEARYVITGNAAPFLVPYRTDPKYYHWKFGNYINVVDENERVLFIVRYSKEMEQFLQKKCLNAEVVDIKDYKLLCEERHRVSDEIRDAEQEIIEQYNGMV